MEIGKNVITAGVVLIIGLVIYIMVTNTIAAQNTSAWDAFGVTFWTSMAGMLLILIVAVGLLAGLLRMFSGRSGEGL